MSLWSRQRPPPNKRRRPRRWRRPPAPVAASNANASPPAVADAGGCTGKSRRLRSQARLHAGIVADAAIRSGEVPGQLSAGFRSARQTERPHCRGKGQYKRFQRGARPARRFPSPSAYVQVTSQRSEAEAKAAYSSLREKYRDILGDRAPIIRRVDLGGKGTYYRAQVGPVSAELAGRQCSQLKAVGGQCIVQYN